MKRPQPLGPSFYLGMTIAFLVLVACSALLARAIFTAGTLG